MAWKLLSVKIKPEMKGGLQELADKQFTSISTIVKQAIDAYLRENNIDWQGDENGKNK